MNENVGVYSVTGLNERVKDMLESSELRNICVRGEISGFSRNAKSGHCYFTLKDEKCGVDCIVYSWIRLPFEPRNGQAVIVRGMVSLYPATGRYQFRVSGLAMQGVGDAAAALEQLRQRLLREGVFDEARKKPLPAFPKSIAVITSETGDAVWDIIHVVGQQWPLTKLAILPTHVQGAEAPPEIAAALRFANRWKAGDLIIVSRGGGSEADRATFNDERVVRAIFESERPVVTAVGHTKNESFADLAADASFSTPTRAAEMSVPYRDEYLKELGNLLTRCDHAIRKRLETRRMRLQDLASRQVMVRPTGYIEQRRDKLDLLRIRLQSAQERRIAGLQNSVGRTAAAMEAMSPLKVLARGYAIATQSDGSVLRSVTDTVPGDHIGLTLQDGELRCMVENRKENGNG